MVVMPPIAPLQNVLEGLDEAQRRAVATTEGPVLLIAGPGRGEDLDPRPPHPPPAHCSALLRPTKVVLCTFTEKAALELRDRLRGAAVAIGYEGDLSSLKTGPSMASATSSSTGTGTSRRWATATKSSTS